MKRIATLLTAGLIIMVAALPAAAQTNTGPDENRLDQVERHDPDKALERVKVHAQKAVDRRLDALARLTEAINDNEHIAFNHQTDLLSDYAAAESGLTDLNAEIQAATDLEEALTLTPKIATEYRVFLVIVPKSHGVVVSDTIVAAGDRIAEAGAEIQAAVDRASDSGIDVSAAQELLDAALADAAGAAATADPVAEDIIGLAASDWPEPAQSQLQGARGTLHDAGDLAHSAVRGLRASVEALRDAIDDHNS